MGLVLVQLTRLNRGNVLGEELDRTVQLFLPQVRGLSFMISIRVASKQRNLVLMAKR